MAEARRHEKARLVLHEIQVRGVDGESRLHSYKQSQVTTGSAKPVVKQIPSVECHQPTLASFSTELAPAGRPWILSSPSPEVDRLLISMRC